MRARKEGRKEGRKEVERRGRKGHEYKQKPDRGRSDRKVPLGNAVVSVRGAAVLRTVMEDSVGGRQGQRPPSVGKQYNKERRTRLDHLSNELSTGVFIT
jgi:hypothetical protein